VAKGEINSPFEVRFERTGGFAAVPLRLDIKSNLLTTEQSDNLRQLIIASDFLNLASANMETAVTPDRFTYVLTLETEDIRHTVRISESHAPPQLKPLIDYLTGMARKLRRGSITS